MRKILSLFAAVLFAVVANATVTNISPTSPYDHDALRQALYYATSGDTIVMAAGTYDESNSNFIAFDKDIVVKAAEGAEVIVLPRVQAQITNGARAEIIGIRFDADSLLTKDTWYNGIFAVADASEGNCLILDNCALYNCPKNAICSNGSTSNKLDSCIVRNCYFFNNAKGCVYLLGPVAYAEVTNCTFANIGNGGGGTIDVRGENVKLRVDHCTFYNCQDVNSDYGAIGYRTNPSTDVQVSNCIFMMPESYSVGRAIYLGGGVVKNCLTYNYTKDSTPHGIHSGPSITDCVEADPLFANAANADFHLGENSPALTAGEDGGAIGDPFWFPAVAPIEPLMKTIYCKMDKAWWTADGAAIGIYTWNDGGQPKAVWPGERMTPVEGEEGVWSFELDVNTYHMCIFTRVNGSGDIADWGAKSGDLTIPTDDNDLYTITSETAVWGDPGVAGTWSKFVPTPAPEPGEATWDWTAASYASASESLVVWSHENVSLSLAKGTSQTVANNYLGGGGNAHTRVYKDQILSITPAEGVVISSIEITATATGNYVTNFKDAAWTNGTAAAADKVITITPTDGASEVSCKFGGATRGTAVKVSYLKGAAPAVAKPAIAGEEFFYDQTAVTITCATEGAAIYYTLDGTEPTAASTPYTAAFNLNASATVKAIAILGSDVSAVVEKAFTKNPSFASFEALIAAGEADKTLIEVSFEKLVIDSFYVSTSNNVSTNKGIYFTINGVAYEIYKGSAAIDASWEIGGKVSGTIRGEWQHYVNTQKGIDIWEVIPSASDWTWAELTYAADEPVVDPWVEIVFTKAEAAGAFNDSVFTVEGSEFSLKCIDTENSKHKTTANNASFGSLEDRHDYSFRLQTSGKSNNKNNMELNIPADGQLRIAVRTGSSADLTRTLVLAQGTDTIYNEVLLDTDTVEGASSPKIFNFVYADVKAGKVSVTYPINAINFYAFAFKEVVLADAPSAAPAEPTYASYQVKAVYSAKYNADCNFGEWSSGTQYTQEEYGKKYVTNNMGYFGLEFTGKNCSEMEALHLDVWAAEDIAFRVVPIHHGTEVGVTVNAQGQKWNAIDIPLTQFEGVTDWSDVYQIKIDNAANLTFWLNNVYFYTTVAPEEDKEAPTEFTAVLDAASYFSVNIKANATDNSGAVEFDVLNGELIIASAKAVSATDKIITVAGLTPNTDYNFSVIAKDEDGNATAPIAVAAKTLAAPAPAPAPTAAADDVKSIYSDAYDFAPDTLNSYNEGWWNAPVMVEGQLAEGDNALFYAAATTGMIGWQFGEMDLTAYAELHIDIYPIADGSILIYPVNNTDPKGEYKDTYNVKGGQWNSLVIDLSGKDLTKIFQIAWIDYYALNGFFIDNVYFAKKSSEGLEDLFVEGKAVKVLHNGQIYILKNNKMYTVMGQPVK